MRIFERGFFEDLVESLTRSLAYLNCGEGAG